MARSAFNMEELVGVINEATSTVKNKVEELRKNSDSISIADMFDLQMMMNHLTQLSEMCTSVVSASNQSIMSMASKIAR